MEDDPNYILDLLKSMFHRSEERLTYVGQDSGHVPISSLRVIGLLGRTILDLDLSLSLVDVDLRPLEQLFALQTLVLDNSGVSDKHCFPFLYHLHTLSLNKNCLQNLALLLGKLNDLMPQLKHLSLLGNPLCPMLSPNIEHTDENYKRYRLYVHQILPKLKFLDSEPLILKVTEETRNPTSFVLELTHSKMISRQKSQSAAITIYKNPEESKAAKNKLSFGKLRYKYSGKHSEGNRFIGNKDL